ncbi:cytidine deaminase [Acidiferrobacter sp. SPIII_3]|jgi:cytidine deaminase|uniref:cytidine deaminase n=1 Tax=Acidiferrobacter sp. SPIII_3 TaxID=1281578 RepID=UPI000D73EC30|nr:cytidine deaminase [Acidiferrobacter sp. SPIII_3]AWP24198.1 cytidine deaminase [Acidiferrobacter sp. SPIII_3]
MSDFKVSGDIARLLRAAHEVIAHAYAPYSGFPVGAAVLTVSGEVFAGCNVENAAYPLGLCAEAAALGVMVSAVGAQRLRAALVLTARPAPSWPCGGCRQRLQEFMGAEAMVYAAGCDAEPVAIPFARLLPLAFGADDLAPRSS